MHPGDVPFLSTLDRVHREALHDVEGWNPHHISHQPSGNQRLASAQFWLSFRGCTSRLVAILLSNIFLMEAISYCKSRSCARSCSCKTGCCNSRHVTNDRKTSVNLKTNVKKDVKWGCFFPLGGSLWKDCFFFHLKPIEPIQHQFPVMFMYHKGFSERFRTVSATLDPWNTKKPRDF